MKYKLHRIPGMFQQQKEEMFGIVKRIFYDKKNVIFLYVCVCLARVIYGHSLKMGSFLHLLPLLQTGLYKFLLHNPIILGKMRNLHITSTPLFQTLCKPFFVQECLWKNFKLSVTILEILSSQNVAIKISISKIVKSVKKYSKKL